MKKKTIYCHIEGKLILRDSVGNLIFIEAPKLVLINKNNELYACRLTFEVNWETYQQIDSKALFNLNPEIRGSFSTQGFLPDANITITANLRSDLLPRFAEYTHQGEAVATYIQTLSQEQPDDPLLSTESWYALHVQQQQQGKCVGYRTFWQYLKLSVNTPETLETGKVMQSLLEFLTKERKDIDLSDFNLQAWEQLLGLDINELFDGVGTELESLFKELINEDGKKPQETTKGELLAVVTNFFGQENWQIYPLEDDFSFGMVAQGENGQWNCRASVSEERRQFVFYSICPVNAPEAKRSAMADFLTRVNWGMVIGNFEFDLDSGEICYKTSIDVGDDPLTTTLTQQLVYSNVLIVDRYLPGIMAVIYGNVTPQEAIAQTEG